MNQSLNCVQANAQRMWLYILLGLGVICWDAPAIAQVVPDATLGAESSQVNSNVIVPGGIGDRIDGGASRGVNLFHSFRDFNVNDGQRVYFSNPAGIQNIFTRVTGNNVSNIRGLLGVEGTANLFLMNPNGILFGPNAQLDIRGSFLATTASSFRFPDGSEFSATNPQGAPLLTINVPIGLQYGPNSTGKIQNQGQLEVGDSLTLSAVNLDLQGTLKATGNITLEARDTVKISSSYINTNNTDPDENAGDVFIQADKGIEISTSTIESIGNLGQISLKSAQGSIRLDSTRLDSSSQDPTVDGDAGDISIEAAQDIAIANSTIKSVGNYGIISLKSAQGSIRFDDTWLDSSNENPEEVAGDIFIDAAKNLEIVNRSEIQTEGNIGRVFIGSKVTPEKVTIANSTLSTDSSKVDGDSGEISIQGTAIAIDSSKISTNAHDGIAGNILIQAGAAHGSAIALTNTTLDAAAFGSQGTTGTIILNAFNRGDISLQGQEQGQGQEPRIYTDTYGKQFIDSYSDQFNIGIALIGGNISINNYFLDSTVYSDTRGGITFIDGHSITLSNGARIATDVQGNEGGSAGDIFIIGNNLSLTGNSQISAKVSQDQIGTAGNIAFDIQGLTSLSGANTKIVNSVEQGAEGAGGYIFLKTGSLVIADGASIDSTMSGIGKRAGDITIHAADQINLLDGAEITASNRSSERGGLAGNIILDTKLLKLDTNTSIRSETGSGGGGNIQITASSLVLLRRNSVISTTAGSAESGGNGGNITIWTPFLVAVPKENSDIIANAFGGKGGTIKIFANRVFGLQTRSRLSPDQIKTIRSNRTSDISASSDVGADGQVAISSLQVDPSQGLSELPVEVVDPSSLITQGCQPNTTDVASRRSEFVITGRGGLPPSVEDPQMGGGVSVPWVQQTGDGRQKAEGGRQKAEPTPAANYSTNGHLLVEAQGIEIALDGTAVLTAQATTTVPHSPGLRTIRCRNLKP